VAATFVSHHLRSPIADGRGKVHQDIRRQTSGYDRTDPPKKHEKALQPAVFRHRLRTAQHPRAQARAQLLGGALFYAMRSCEYTDVGSNDRKTRPIRAKDLVFMSGNKVLPHHHPLLRYADTLTITFGDQKTEIRNEQVTQHNNQDCELNPIVNWAETVTRLRGYPGYRDDWEVYKFYDGSFSNITATEMLEDIRAAVDEIGEEILGYTSADVGTHSVRSSLAMLMYLAGEPVYTIMLIGRWRSTAFLNYIEHQIREFTEGVSARMIQSRPFFYMPSATTNTTPNTARGQATRPDHRPRVFGRGSLRQHLLPRNI